MAQTREQKRIYQSKWRAKNREMVNARERLWRKNNKEKTKLYNKRYQKKINKHKGKELLKTPVWIARNVEMKILGMLDNTIDMNDYRMNNKDYDILWNGKKVDIKSSSLHSKKDRDVQHYSFRRQRDNDCDLYLCAGTINGKIRHLYIIPKQEFRMQTLCVNPFNSKSKYKRYEFEPKKTAK